MLCILEVFMFGFVIVAARELGIVAALSFLAIFLMGLWQLIPRAFITQVDQTGLRVNKFGYTENIGWREIDSVRSRAFEDSLYVKSYTGQEIRINSQLGGFVDILDRVRKVRADLWPVKDGMVFHAIKWILVPILLMGSIFIWAGIRALRNVHIALNDPTSCAGLFLLGMGIFTIIFFERNFYWRVTLKHDRLLIDYTFTKMEIMRSEVLRIYVDQKSTSGQIAHHIVIEHIHGKPVYFTVVKQGFPMLYNTLKNWKTGLSNID